MMKFRDLHSIWFMFRNQTVAQTVAIEEDHGRCERGAVDHQAPKKRVERDIETIARIMLTAFLSTYGSALFYLIGAMSDDGQKWLRKEKKRRPLLDSFERLRNREIHHEPLSTLIGVRYMVKSLSASPTAEDPNVSHVHFASLHQGAGFAIDALSASQQFKAHPDLVKLLTDKSILELTHNCIHELSALINEAVALGYSDSDKAFVCWLCRTRLDTQSQARQTV
jgi:hypothetical protein